jgi:cytochrome c oxidase cbb3-type subunit 3
MTSPNEPDRLLEHDYDGIREYDNPMPAWWLWIFYVTILFVPFYYFAPAPFGEGGGNAAEYAAEVAAYESAHPPQETMGPSAEQLLAMASDRSAVTEGQAVYTTNCAACHGVDGGGVIGPNLADDAWLHGGTPEAIHRTVRIGVLEKGMPGWERLLKPAQVDQVVAYVISLRGSTPTNPKAPEGTVEPGQ